jgi:hypothetical protein
LEVRFLEGRKHLPIVTRERAAQRARPDLAIARVNRRRVSKDPRSSLGCDENEGFLGDLAHHRDLSSAFRRSLRPLDHANLAVQFP